jgi:excisionase family DNA binding protein
MNTLNTEKALRLAAEACTWPTIAELAETYGVSGRTLRQAVADGRLPAIKVNVARVNPDDFAAWFAARQR